MKIRFRATTHIEQEKARMNGKALLRLECPGRAGDPFFEHFVVMEYHDGTRWAEVDIEEC